MNILKNSIFSQFFVFFYQTFYILTFYKSTLVILGFIDALFEAIYVTF